jgi:hypothetical protein
VAKNLLSSLEKRDLLNQSAVSADQLQMWGSRYEEEGFVNDAIDFYERADFKSGLENLISRAMEDGDAFLFGRILKALGREAEPLQWIALAKKATELGKTAFAREAYKKSGTETPAGEP